ncbi:MAG: hypothetical protein DME98_06670 [Verrucomicrobia bacterium]|jgi:hypothetical protein|nr:MAG: hypothetical protein DME98_06670 [Verrucomicrobiota bacterium]PYJ31154.1 MAG: hypothetical protein DME88_16495 [Verrucomicrobiota bacterium]
MENAIVTSRSGGLPARRRLGGGGQSAESNAIANLKAALRERLAIIQDEESRRNADAHMTRLRTVSQKIDRLQEALPQPVDSRLAHYLQRRSYDKALEFIESL